MLELFVLACVVMALVVFAGLAKFVLTLLLLPLKAAFWLLGALFQLVLLPFQIIGGLLLALLFVPLLLIGLPILLGIGLPLLVIGGLFGGLLLIGAAFCALGGLIFGC